MVEVSGREYLDFAPEEVFTAGIRAEVWPIVEGLLLQPQEEILALGGLMSVGLSMQALKIGLPGSVTIFEHGRTIVIEGESRLAAARIEFELANDRRHNGTQVDYALTVWPRSLATKLAEPAIRKFIAAAVPSFTTGYTKNVSNFLLKQVTL